MPIVRVEKSRNFTPVSNVPFRDKRLSLRARGLLATALTLPDDWGYSLAGLLSLFPDGKQALRAALAELEAAGYLTRTRENAAGGKFAFVYVFREAPHPVEPCAAQPCTEKPHTVEPSTAAPCTVNPQLLSNDMYETLGEEIPPLSPKGEGGEVEQTALPVATLGEAQASPAPKKAGASARQKRQPSAAAFDRFWGAYPRRQGKEAARKAWAKIRPDDALLAEMLAALERQRASDQWRRDGGQFIPYPATWLNGRRWEDEEAAPTEGKAQSYPAIPQRILL